MIFFTKMDFFQLMCRLEEQGVNTGGLLFNIFFEIAKGLLLTPVAADTVGQALVGHPAQQDDVGEAGGQVESSFC